MMIIEGAISVKACINSNKRIVEEIYIQKDKKTKDFNYIRKLAKNNNIKLNELERNQLDQLLEGKSHGGIGALVSNKKEDDFNLNEDIFYIDGVEDPFNLGYICRTLYALGFKNILLSKREYSNIEKQLLKSSAGAYEFLNIKVSNDILNELDELKNNNYYIYALFRNENAKDVFKYKFDKKAIYIFGGEKRGISSEILDKADELLYISYQSDFRNALNAAAALDVVATLICKDKMQ